MEEGEKEKEAREALVSWLARMEGLRKVQYSPEPLGPLRLNSILHQREPGK